MNPRVLLGLVLASCSDPRGSACKDVKLERTSNEAGDAALLDAQDNLADDGTSDCTMSDAGETGFWAKVDRSLDRLAANDVDSALVAAVAKIQSMRAVNEALEAGEPHRIDEHRGAVFVSHECGAYSGGARLFLIGRTSADHWGVLDSVALPSGTEHSALVASSGGSFVFETAAMGTQQKTSKLLLVRARGDQWERVFARDDLINLRVTRASGAVVANWAEDPRSLTHSIDGPQLSFEATLPLSRTDAPAAVRSTTPWFQAFDSYCHEHRSDGRLPCGPDDWLTGVARAGRFAALQIEGSDADISCQGESIGGFIAGDRTTVVELREQAGRWTVLAARPADRGCAAARTSVTRSSGQHQRPARMIARSPVRLALAVTGQTLAWTTEDTAITTDMRSRMARDLGDQPLFIAMDAGTIYWISEETGRLRSLAANGSTPTTLAELPLGAAGLAAHDGTIYWSMYSEGEVWRYRNGRAEVFASGLEMPMGVTVDGDSVLVATAAAIIAIAPDGRVRNTGVEVLAPIAVASRNGALVWIEAGGRVMAASDHGARVIADRGRPTQLVIRDRDVFWVDASDRTVRAARLD